MTSAIVNTTAISIIGNIFHLFAFDIDRKDTIRKGHQMSDVLKILKKMFSVTYTFLPN